MVLLVGTVLVALLVVGPAALTGQPLLMLLGVAFAGVVLVLARRWPLRDR